MKKNELTPDTLMIAEMARELGISPLDLFVYWIKTGKIKNISISVAFDDDEEIKIEIDKSSFEKEAQQSSEHVVDDSEAKSSPSVFLPSSKSIVPTAFEEDNSVNTTSFSKGKTSFHPTFFYSNRLHIKCCCFPLVGCRGDFKLYIFA